LNFINTTNAILTGLTVTIALLTGLSIGLLKLFQTIKEFKHELNSRMTELVDATSSAARAEGHAAGREEGRIIAKDLLKEQQKPPLVHTDDLGP